MSFNMPDWLYNLRRNATDSIRSELETEDAGLLLTNVEILFMNEGGIQRAPLLEMTKVGRSGAELVINGRDKELIRGEINAGKDSLGAFFKKAQEVTVETRKRAELELQKAQEAASTASEHQRLEAEAVAKEQAEAQAIAERAKLGRTPGMAVGPRPEDLLARGEKVSARPTIVEKLPLEDHQESNTPPQVPLTRRLRAAIADQVLIILVLAFIQSQIRNYLREQQMLQLLIFDTPENYEALARSAAVWITIIAYALPWLYFVVLESSPLQTTLGKLLVAMRISDLQGKRIGFAKANIRFIVKYGPSIGLSLLVLVVSNDIFVAQIIGFIVLVTTFCSTFFFPNRRALHDVAAGTTVTTFEAPTVSEARG